MLKAKNRQDNSFVIPYMDQDLIPFISLNPDKFVCPNCDERVIFVNGSIKIPHFRHTATNSCDSEPETSDHIQMKYTLLRKLRLDIDHLEYNLGWSIPDIYIPQRRIAIELQYSPLSEEEFLARTKRYSMNDICVLWIFHESLFDFDNGFTKAFIRAAHKLYFGRVYVFKDEDVYPLKLVSQKRVIPESFFTEGYTKTLLNKKDHHLGDPVQDYVLANKNIRYIDNDIFHLAMFYDEDLLKDVKT